MRESLYRSHDVILLEAFIITERQIENSSKSVKSQEYHLYFLQNEEISSPPPLLSIVGLFFLKIYWGFFCEYDRHGQTDTNLQIWFCAYANGPNLRSNLCKNKVFKHKYTCFSLKSSQLIMGLVPSFPQIKVSRVKFNFLKLELLLLQLYSWYCQDWRGKYQ